MKRDTSEQMNAGDVSPSAETPSAGEIPAPPEDPEARLEVLDAFPLARAYKMASEYYASLVENPPPDREPRRLVYMQKRTSLLADLFSDEKRCTAADAVRGSRVLALRHVSASARDFHREMADGLCVVLGLALGFEVDAEPALNGLNGACRTLLLWYGQVLRADRFLSSGGSLSPILQILPGGVTDQSRLKVAGDLFTQGMADLGVLIACMPLAPGDPTPQYQIVGRPG